jgi:hypothetical protein
LTGILCEINSDKIVGYVCIKIVEGEKTFSPSTIKINGKKQLELSIVSVKPSTTESYSRYTFKSKTLVKISTANSNSPF